MAADDLKDKAPRHPLAVIYLTYKSGSPDALVTTPLTWGSGGEEEWEWEGEQEQREMKRQCAYAEFEVGTICTLYQPHFEKDIRWTSELDAVLL